MSSSHWPLISTPFSYRYQEMPFLVLRLFWGQKTRINKIILNKIRLKFH